MSHITEAFVLELVSELIKVALADRESKSALADAETMISQALATREERTSFLMTLARHREEWRLTDEHYAQILEVTARMLKSDVDLIHACRSIIENRD